MYQHNDRNDPYAQILNASDAASQQNRDKSIKYFCQICSHQKWQSEMYTISERCDKTHIFCIDCLSKKLEQAIVRNQDMYCPIDFCPQILSQTSRFFMKINNNLHNRYVAWKNSDKYIQRNQSFRKTRQSKEIRQFNNQVSEPYFGQNIKINSNSLQKEQQPIKKEKKKKQKNKKKVQKHERKPLFEQQINQQQKMLPAPVVAPINYLKQNLAPPIPFQNKKQMQNHLVQNNENVVRLVQQQQMPCSVYFIKMLLIIIGLPLMFVMMALLMINMILIYAIMIAAIIASLGFITLSFYCLTKVLTSEDEQAQKQYIFYCIAALFVQFICIGLVKFYADHLRRINYLIIKNSWIWWIRQIIKIWAYPHAPPTIKFGPNFNQQLNRPLLA